MPLHAFSEHHEEDDGLDQESLLETISSLREDLSSMKSSMRRMLRENLELRQELGVRPRQASVSELNRVRDEVDMFARLYDGAPAARRERTPRAAAGGGRRGDMMRTMMMVMMMSELF